MRPSDDGTVRTKRWVGELDVAVVMEEELTLTLFEPKVSNGAAGTCVDE